MADKIAYVKCLLKVCMRLLILRLSVADGCLWSVIGCYFWQSVIV